MSMTARAKPVALAPSPWPEVPSDDPVGEVARMFAINVRDAVGNRSLRSVAEASGLTHVTLLNILGGKVWPDLSTIARLENGLGMQLWPKRDVGASPTRPAGV
jgi:hypothetical protein